MVTGPRAPDDRQDGNGQPAPAGAPGVPGDDPLEVYWARLAVFWALVLRRFRAYADRVSGPEQQREEDR